MTESLYCNSLTRNFLAAIFTVNYCVVRACLCASRSNFVFLNCFAGQVTESFAVFLTANLAYCLVFTSSLAALVAERICISLAADFANCAICAVSLATLVAERLCIGCTADLTNSALSACSLAAGVCAFNPFCINDCVTFYLVGVEVPGSGTFSVLEPTVEFVIKKFGIGRLRNKLALHNCLCRYTDSIACEEVNSILFGCGVKPVANGIATRSKGEYHN